MPELSLWAIFASSFLASTLLPGGSELAVGYSAFHSSDLFTLWAVATTGNTLGGLTGWGLGWWIRRYRSTEQLFKPKHQNALAKIRNHGSPALLLSWLPIVGDPLCLVAGWAGVRLIPAVTFIAIGKGLRYAILLLLLPVTG